MRDLYQVAAATLLLVFLPGCSHTKKLSRDDLRSELTKAISFAAETELLSEVVRACLATPRNAQEHASFLTDEIKDSLETLERSQADPADEKTVAELNAALRTMASESEAIASSLSNDAAAAAVQEQAVRIREQLQRTKAGL